MKKRVSLQNFAQLFLLLPIICFSIIGAKSKSSDPKAGNDSKTLSPIELEKIQINLKSKGFIGVSYIQKIKSPILTRKPREATGEAYFSSQGKARLNQKTPEAKEIIFDGVKLTEYNPTNNEANIINQGGQLADRISRLASLILDFNKLLGEFSLRSSKRNSDGTVDIEMASLKDVSILSVEVRIDEKKGFVTGVKILYRDQREHDFTFFNPQFSQKDPNQFSFMPPKGVKIKTL